MKIWKRALLIALCALMILAMPFVLCAGEMLGDTTWVDGGEDDLTFDFDFSRLLFPSAYAEEEKSYALPIDFSAGMQLNPDGYTEDGYQDDSITVRMETREENGVTWRLAFVEIKDPSQLRTATAGKLKYTDKTTALVSVMACAKNAVVAINGDYFTDDQAKRSFEYRMGEPVKSNDGNPKGNKKRDILIIDENGDFHTFVCSDKDGMKEFAQSGRKIVNAFTFGPALVQEGQLLEIDRNYSYNPNKPEPRAAIGQMGPLSYVFILAEGRNESAGASIHDLARFAYDLGCVEAYNLDGGNSATLVFNNRFYMDKNPNSERDQYDIIYFASAVDPSEWKQE